MNLSVFLIAAGTMILFVVTVTYLKIRSLSREGEKILARRERQLNESALLADEKSDKILELAKMYDNIDPTVREVLYRTTNISKISFVRNALDDVRVYPTDIARILDGENE